jgi:DnaK suppressor protein
VTRDPTEPPFDTEHYRRKLQALERQLVVRVGQEIDTARDARDDQPAAGDLARVDELRDEYFTLADTDTAILRQVRAALDRIANGTYGRCLVDDAPIDPKRLEAVPWTPYCREHQAEHEQRAGMRTPSA